MKIVLILLAAVCAWAQAPLSSPPLGFVRDAEGGIRAVTGVAGNFILGEPAGSAVLSAAFSSSAGLLKTASSLIAVDSASHIVSTHEAPGGPALFSLLAGPSALVYFPASQSLYRWRSGKLRPLPFDPTSLAGTALSVAETGPDGAEFLVQRADGLWLIEIELKNGSSGSAQAIPGATSPALLLADGSLLFGDGKDLVLRLANQSELRYPLGAAADFLEPMTGGWIHVRARNRLEFALRLPAQDGGRLYALPAPPSIGQ